jgi:gas vesicle protein
MAIILFIIGLFIGMVIGAYFMGLLIAGKRSS